MTGYTTFWNCRTCGKRQESISGPQVHVCESCIHPLASKLCWEMLKVPLGPGIDEDYFVRRAYDYAETLLGRRAINPPELSSSGEPIPIRHSPMVGETKS